MRALVNLKQEVTLILTSLIRGSDRIELKLGFSISTGRLQQIANQELSQLTFKVVHLGTLSHSKFHLTNPEEMRATFHKTRKGQDQLYPHLLCISHRTFMAFTMQAMLIL